jgi:carbon monoxide dehydrogenase subunit G
VQPIRIERAVNAAPAAVFAAATDVANWPTIVPAITRTELLTPGPVGLGTRFRETRTVFGRTATEEMEFVAFEPGRGTTIGADSHGCRYRTRFDVEPSGSGTRLVMTFEAQPLTVVAKVMSILMKPMMKKMAEMCARDLDAIKAHCERGA